jgi:mono/diheme cytochrome c family protein
MAAQPSFRPLKPSAFFADDRSARPLVEGTVPRTPRGEFHGEGPYYTGRQPGKAVRPQQAAGVVAAPAPFAAGAFLASGEEFVNELPFTHAELAEQLRRGQERFNIYCAVCHGRDGDGKGMIPQRGFTQPPSFHTDLSRGYRLRGIEMPLREAPLGYYFDVITNGFGAMPDYREQVPVEDRWAVIAWIRTLQFSRHAPVADVGAAVQRRLEGGQP